MYTSGIAISSLISNADLVVKLVIFLLFLASFCSWAIIFDKFAIFKALYAKAKKFEKEFWSGKEMLSLYEKASKHDDHPMAHIFVTAIHEWQLQDKINLKDNYAKERFKERIYQSMIIAKNRAITKLQKHIDFLATVSSASPFVGLFGTIWGIMNSFSAIVGAKNTSLSVVAPGISEALFATAIGLFTAIPALVFYNYFVGKLNLYNDKIEDFAIEILNLLSRELDKN